MGASYVTATKESSWTKAQTRLIEEVVGRDNMMAAYHRVMSNKGASGIDKMTVGELKAHLVECWPRIREELLEGRYMPQPVRLVACGDEWG